MNVTRVIAVFAALASAALTVGVMAQQPPTAPLCISGVYPHLAVFNGQGECGIGAVVPWAGKLWMLTYSPHEPHGSPDKLYTVGDDMQAEIRPESVGGTPAGRIIHRESNQLFIGPYAIDAQGHVRVISPQVMPGRLTAVARHLTDPANRVYYYDMEGPLYEVDVHTLAVKKLFDKSVPGWHGKGAYTGQGRLVIANNGELPAAGHSYATVVVGGPPQGPEEAGALAQWDGTIWRIVERRQFTEVTGPGGILGAPSDTSPLWSVGWDRRSVLLKLLDRGQWQTFRLPKASVTYDHRGGWYTEWPRIREVGGGRMLMDMHGMFYDFPRTFDAAHTGGIAPIASHLRMVPDFCDWNGRLVLAADDTSVLQNPMAGQSQSNLWFGKLQDLYGFGPRAGAGGPWVHDAVRAGEPSTPYLINGFDHKVLHLVHDAATTVRFTLQIDRDGDGRWTRFNTITVPPATYRYFILPANFRATWIRLVADRDCVATAYFHYSTPGHDAADGRALFASLADLNATAAVNGGLLRPSSLNHNLLYVAQQSEEGDHPRDTYCEVDERIHFSQPPSRADAVKQVVPITRDFTVDDASVVMMAGGRRYRLPKGDARYETPFPTGWPRALRECVTERTLLNAQGTFYLIGRESGLPAIQPICTHHKQITDFCTWRGLLVMSGNRADAQPDGHYFGSAAGGLWFGAIDDLWKLGKPVGHGGPWHDTLVTAGLPSDPYLMTGYDHKTMMLTQAGNRPVNFAVEVDFDHSGWHRYETFMAPPGQSLTHRFPEGYSAHWVRLVADHACRATATFVYD